MVRSSTDFSIAIFAIAALAFGLSGCRPPRRQGSIVLGNAAKLAGSAVFVGHRPRERAVREDMLLGRFLHRRVRPDFGENTVTTHGFGARPRTAVFREGLGCTLLPVRFEGRLEPERLELARPERQPLPRWEPPELLKERLDRVLDWAFSEPSSLKLRRTRAVVVVLGGRVIAERYGPGYGPDMPMIGWSLSKSVTNALIGILVGQGKLSLGQKAPVPEWGPDDPRSAITMNHLLRMVSGLEFFELAPRLKDLAQMLFMEPDMAAYAAKRPLTAQPGKKWRYSTGTSNILARIIRGVVAGTHEDYLAFPHRALFDRIGMTSAIMEADAAGNLVGGAYVYASPRDWARFGLLYLYRGFWKGDRIFPAWWVDYTRKATMVSKRHEFGAHFWTNEQGCWKSLPRDTFMAIGFEGQVVAIVPSRRLVAVRMGRSLPFGWSYERFVESLLRAIPYTPREALEGVAPASKRS